ncbi:MULTISPECIES: DNA-directed RNA polymerase subunit omega [Campylobacter]|uniref:DNA-directed RNA polymerase subunit omega n=1 Tax=Campylobacter hominis (strain ATCC BAA-381 / DSM 21671 / CCUG 45161 / LMG 19568 / NCTC 13146 / CH001A) TaxID=360107 RepID=A7I2U2_CAMHC|nr:MULTISPECIES: DNA-directed RNA polymerase subunit omega [Campylobacter]ABS51147.1 DNA-directed RNA polymerase, omega subunit [Campylobacter hominis ATCC BAA-381]MCI6641608.1 DNA-directed RNA polymerase subunit omega [Campylobacter sp.]MDD7421812.1 DNA-directed RNA polymerase subunit omega [Campylobacter hominis]MDY3116431.1 DNA-directed RNA polymerase subunit omega [Campylobacter hominis]UAK85922.1 DNA-directed RNA polymerase subunit omega [Campylobacter hominis]
MPRIEEIITKALERVNGNRYQLSLMVAKRAEQLSMGEENLLDIDTRKMKFSDIALREIAEGKILLDGFKEPSDK